ncbi:rod shape-determining protein MreC [Acidocella sp.]|uniref:rod shape-determining protein MreC n=1 Tax=Acidocella sp. TaxID=50710 RepID=UPI00260B4129|nr:rod shape-determining protein MreC [Acidocella sp.]
MIRLSIPLRQALSKLTFPVMLTLSLGVVLVGRADQSFDSHLHTGFDDLMAPVYALADPPVQALASSTSAVGHLFMLSSENAALRAENARLAQWQAVALALEAQNNALKAALNYTPANPPAAVTGEVVADTGGVYSRSVLVLVPTPASTAPSLVGAVAMDGRGVAGRVIEAGARAARVLLITDINSRIPVALGASGAPALMAGTNGDDPKLLYWSPGNPPNEGDVVLTSAQGGAFPPGLPVGVVHYDSQNNPVVLPFADLPALRLLRLFTYPETLPELTPIPHVAPAARHAPTALQAHHRRH